MIQPYKLKHVPTGLYYQPHKHRGSNLSKRGKIYQTSTNGLSSAIKYHERNPESEQLKKFSVYVEKGSVIHKMTLDTLNWIESRWSFGQLRAETLLSDWILVNIL